MNDLGNDKSGRVEIRAALAESRRLFSFFVNLLILTGPVFMLQIYDRAPSSRFAGGAGGLPALDDGQDAFWSESYT